jgi:hypothetical protein
VCVGGGSNGEACDHTSLVLGKNIGAGWLDWVTCAACCMGAGMEGVGAALPWGVPVASSDEAELCSFRAGIKAFRSLVSVALMSSSLVIGDAAAPQPRRGLGTFRP